MNREISPKVKSIINESMKEAESFDDVKLRPEHIILSILMDEKNDCVKIFNELNVDTANLYDLISDHLRKIDLTPRLNTSTRKKLPFSDETKAIFKVVDKECENLNDNIIETTHLMLSILKSDLEVNKVLEIKGITYKSFIEIIKGMKKEPKNGMFDGDDIDDQESYKRPMKKAEPKSKTPVLDNFCRDVSKAVENGEIDAVIGRKVEIKRVSQILSRRKKNNPIPVSYTHLTLPTNREV